MDRVYMNRREGERRIHVEIEEAEITELLDSPDSEAGRRLADILTNARHAFQGSPS